MSARAGSAASRSCRWRCSTGRASTSRSGSRGSSATPFRRRSTCSTAPCAPWRRSTAAALATAGLDEATAARRAAFRVFGSKPGAYGAGLQALIDERGWHSAADLARAYVAWGGYAYGDGAAGTAEHGLFERRLATIDGVLHNQDNQEHDLLDSDDYYQFEGGMAAAAATLGGRRPAIYHNDHSRPESPRIRSLEEEIARIVRGRVVNPKWIAGAMRHGYKGAFEMAATVDYLFAFAATTGAVADHHFDAVYDAYLGDEAVDGGAAGRGDRARPVAAALQRRAGRAPPARRPQHRRGGMSESDDDKINRQANEKSARRKAAKAKILAGKTIEKGLLMVHTGTGKGKSTAAFGLVLRCLGHGFPVAIVQFVKGKWQTGERAALDRFADLVSIRSMGEGFTWETQDRARDIAAARAAWAAAEAALADPRNRLVLLDELNIVLRYDYLPVAEVVAALTSRRPDLHVVVTGRNARPELVEAADLVTEMTLVKHPFRAGVKAQQGIEF